MAHLSLEDLCLKLSSLSLVQSNGRYEATVLSIEDGTIKVDALTLPMAEDATATHGRSFETLSTPLSNHPNAKVGDKINIDVDCFAF